MTVPNRHDPQDVTEAVLEAMLCEALTLTDEIAAVGSLRRAMDRPDSEECASRLRLAARLSRIAAWASLRGSNDPERLSIASAALLGADGAVPPPKGPEDDPLLEFRLQVDRLVERARRLDALFLGESEAFVATAQADSATILPFVRPAAAPCADDVDAADAALSEPI